MQCDCLTRVEREIADYLRPKAGDDARATVQNTAFFLSKNDSELSYVLQVMFRVKGNKKGYTSERGKEVGCNVTFCPFCGQSANRKVPQGRDEGIEKALGLRIQS